MRLTVIDGNRYPDSAMILNTAMSSKTHKPGSHWWKPLPWFCLFRRRPWKIQVKAGETVEWQLEWQWSNSIIIIQSFHHTLIQACHNILITTWYLILIQACHHTQFFVSILHFYSYVCTLFSSILSSYTTLGLSSYTTPYTNLLHVTSSISSWSVCSFIKRNEWSQEED